MLQAEELTTAPARSINDPDIQRQIQALRDTDNTTNALYLLREYAIIALILGITIFCFETFWIDAWSLLWAVPLTLVTITLIGACQHRLATFTHEAAHYILFKNRLLNEFVSEWFCMFPILGTTHSYRIQHYSHHQHPNDPEQDPDFPQLHRSGHGFQFPMTTWQFIWHTILKQILWPPNVLRYVLVRAQYQFERGDTGPYRKGRKTSLTLRLIGLAYHVALVAVLAWCVWTEDMLLLAWLPPLMAAVLFGIVALAPETWFSEHAIKSDIPMRWQNALRFAFNTLVLNAVVWITLLTGRPAWLYFFVLWLIPLGTSFAFFMMVRQVVQHGNADQERYTNTRIFLVHPLLRLSIFPIGNDYHLPHHLFMTIPFYNLEKLHTLLMQTEPYASQAVVVTGYFFHSETPPGHPTVLDLMTNEPVAAR
jgi:fatty acid desaturase